MRIANIYGNAVAVSKNGEIYKCTDEGLAIVPKHLGNGYYRVNMKVNGKSRSVSLHRVIALAYLDRPEGCGTVNHINEIKLDNRACNLEWCTAQYNREYSRHRQIEARTHAVEILDKNCSVLRKCRTAEEAAKLLGTRYSCIQSACIKGKRLGEFYLRYVPSHPSPLGSFFTI